MHLWLDGEATGSNPVLWEFESLGVCDDD
jgi:hypothetical protein